MMPLSRVEADRWNPGKSPKTAGLSCWRVHSSVAASFAAAVAVVRAQGGIVPSAGGLRRLDAKITAGRALYSLHILGLAVDLHTACDRLYAVTYDSTHTHRHTLYPIVAGGVPSPLPRVRWVKGSGGLWIPYETADEPLLAAIPLSLTAIFATQGWTPIGPRYNKLHQCVCPEFWHFQRPDMLRRGETFLQACVRFGVDGDVSRFRPQAGAVRWNGERFA